MIMLYYYSIRLWKILLKGPESTPYENGIIMPDSIHYYIMNGVTIISMTLTYFLCKSKSNFRLQMHVHAWYPRFECMSSYFNTSVNHDKFARKAFTVLFCY